METEKQSFNKADYFIIKKMMEMYTLTPIQCHCPYLCNYSNNDRLHKNVICL